jgi:hypothetical protein
MGEKLKHTSRSTSEIPTCPTSCRFEGDLVGCGGSNLVWDEVDEYYDCCGCGLFFNREQAFLNRKTSKRQCDEQTLRPQA